jgi:hypothetical protein
VAGSTKTLQYPHRSAGTGEGRVPAHYGRVSGARTEAVVEEGVRKMTDQVVTGIFTLLGVAMGLFGERWVRTWGKVRCDVDWGVARSASSVDSPGSVEVQERQLKATFSNRKDIPVTIWDMRVVFYKGDRPLGEEERPHMEFTGASGGRMPFAPVNLPPRIPVTRTIFVAPPSNIPNSLRAVEEADRVEFEAIIDEASDIRMRLALWRDLEPQTKHC